MGLKDLKKNYLVDCAAKLFLSRSINEVTIRDIAVYAGVGEMTVYRYFGKKQAIVEEVVISLQNVVAAEYFKLDQGVTGFEKLSQFYKSYLDVFVERPDYFHFIREFDSLMREENNGDLQRYEDELDNFKHLYIDAYELGLKDGTIKPIKDIELFYFTTTHALIELCKKLSYSKTVLPQDENIEKTEEIRCLIETFLSSVKNS